MLGGLPSLTRERQSDGGEDGRRHRRGARCAGKTIRESVKKELGKTAEESAEAPKSQNIRDKIHDRMRELDKKR